MVTDDRFTAIDLFAGAGGLTEGLKLAGFSVVAAVELESLAAETYQLNHPEVQLWEEDINDVSPSEMMQALELDKGDLSLLAGCPPCQGFSSIRTRNGALTINDSRNDLIFKFLDFVEAFDPATVMMENVPGMADYDKFAEFLERLSGLSYEHSVANLNAADYGVPQRRWRLVLLAGKGFMISAADAPKIKSTVADAIQSLSEPGESGDELHDVEENRSDRVMNMIRKIPPDGGSRTDLDEEDQLDCHKRTSGFKDVYGRMKWDDVAPTLTSGCVNPSKGRFLHPEQHRAITLREAALLQSFRADYRFSLRNGKYAAARLIGNALPPLFVEFHGKRIIESLANRENGNVHWSESTVTDVFSKEERSRIMSQVRNRDTDIELAVRKRLWARGIRYRVNCRDVIGAPDICHKGLQIAVFLDGCFWHGCPQCGERPKSNAEFWKNKIKINVERRKQVVRELTNEGWSVLGIWEHEISDDVEKVVDKVQELFDERRASTV